MHAVQFKALYPKCRHGPSCGPRLACGTSDTILCLIRCSADTDPSHRFLVGLTLISTGRSLQLGRWGATRSRRCGCAEDLGEADSTCCSASSIPPGGASPVMEGCQAPG